MKLRDCLPIALIGLLAAGPVQAADPLFDALDSVAIRINAPLRAMAKDRDDEPEYREGTLTLLGADGGDQQTFQIKIRPRGNSRRDRNVCDFPPLRINFRESEVGGTLFDHQNKLKLVTHCERGDRHTAYVYKEYLVYRMLNQLTESGFRVRPLTIDYVDSERDATDTGKFGFFIEDEDRLAKRLGLTVTDPISAERSLLEPNQTALMEMFQFMIGNTDFSFIAGPEGEGCCHNAKLLMNDAGRYLPMPYDFDITGFVDPPYATVNERLPIKSVRQRLYRGGCQEAFIQQEAVDRFRQVREALLRTVEEETPLADRPRRDARRYVEDFYSVLNDPKAYASEITRDCQG